ncbi:SET domain-containing protein [Phlegmacium glaucopus]|nr:SET domain-containing protein [Phlegmacium glaucopus]
MVSQTWTSGNQTYVLHTVVLTSSFTNEEKTVISCLLNPSLIPLLPDLSFAQNLVQSISYCVLPTPHKGFGMFATRDIPAGELIAIEHPALILPAASLPEEAYNEIGLQLPDRRRAELMAMANSRTIKECPSPVEGIVRTNALALQLEFPKSMANDGPDAKLYGGVYPLLNRCNHSCGPNAAIQWNLATLSASLYALRPIRTGEEILKTYIDPVLPRASRVATLLKNYRFSCDCPWCDVHHCSDDNNDDDSTSNKDPPFSSEELAQIAASDNNRALLVEWIFTHPGYLKWSTDLCRPDDLVISAHLEALALIDKEGLQGLQNLFMEEIAMCYAILGDEIEFRRWGQRVMQLSRVEDPPLAAKFEQWLEDPPRNFKRWAWRKKQRMQRPGRRKLKSAEDLELPIMEDTFQLLFQVAD